MTLTTPTVVEAPLLYALPTTDGSKPYSLINADPKTGIRERNFKEVSRIVPIENVRDSWEQGTADIGLDISGFQFYKEESPYSERAAGGKEPFTSDEDVEEKYYPESEALIKKLTGASRAVIFDHTIRRRRPEDLEDTPQKRQPVQGVHVDQTAASSRARVIRHLPPSLHDSLLAPGKRFQLINLWRPIKHDALDHPLALCDWRSVDHEKELVPTTLVYPDSEGETMGVLYGEGHKWKYLRGMTPKEIVLIKCFDSIQDESVAICTPHTAFEDPSTPADAALRESIELRFLVFYD